MFSELFSAENVVTFPFDPNVTQTGKSGRIIRTRKNDVVKNSEQKGAEMPRNVR